MGPAPGLMVVRAVGGGRHVLINVQEPATSLLATEILVSAPDLMVAKTVTGERTAVKISVHYTAT